MRPFTPKILRLVARLRRLAPFLPWLSLAWGISSGFVMNRAYDKAPAILAYTSIFIVLSIAFMIWLKWYELAVTRSGRISRPIVADFFIDYATQTTFQYVVMFTLPFLWLSKSYPTLCIAVCALMTTMWSPCWEKLSRSLLYLCALRTICGSLGLSFCFAIFQPRLLALFYPIMWGAIALLALPVELLVKARRVKPRHFIIAAAAALIVTVGAATERWVPFPLVSVWLKNPALGVGIEGHSLKKTWPDKVKVQSLDSALAPDWAVCCVTPVVSPRGMRYVMTHEWYANAELIDRIVLKEVTTFAANESASHPFRTYSCKRHFPELPPKVTLSCRVMIADRIVVGSVAVELEQDASARSIL